MSGAESQRQGDPRTPIIAAAAALDHPVRFYFLHFLMNFAAWNIVQDLRWALVEREAPRRVEYFGPAVLAAVMLYMARRRAGASRIPAHGD